MACDSCVGKDGRVWAPFEDAAPSIARDLWPQNFIETSEGRGMYYCPTCSDGLSEARAKQARIEKSAPNKKTSTPDIQPTETGVAESINSTKATEHVWLLVALATYLFAIFVAWTISSAVGRWMLLSIPIVVLIGGAYYFAEGTSPRERSRHFVINLQKVAISLVALWILAKCSSGGGDGPIDSYFRH